MAADADAVRAEYLSYVQGKREAIKERLVQQRVAERRAVATGMERGQQVIVISGLEGGERVIVNAPQAISEGARVEENNR